ncbi:MAG TPA: ribonuclease P protein component [Chloroflexota bacterium]|nr:ribonuclease P protein component [Chloroflexota bacterium]
MLPKQHRLLRTRDFTRVRRRGRSAGDSLLVLYVLPVRSPDLRVGFSVSKRVGKAVTRNRVKRVMREIARRDLGKMRRGQDLVFIARPAAAQATYADLDASMARALGKTGALRAEETRHA